MIRNPLLIAFFLMGMSASPWAQGEDRKSRFRAYRNPPKPGLAVLPVQSRKLDRATREMFDRSLLKEALNLECCKPVPFPDEIRLDSLGQVAPGDLPRLKERFGIAMILQTRLEHAADRNGFSAELIVTESGDIGASFDQECECAVGDLASWMLPQAIRKLDRNLKSRAPHCSRGTVLIEAPVVPGSHEPDSMRAQASTGAAGSAAESWGSGSFCMDAYEYPNSQGEAPAVDKTWKEAAALCAAKGKRLCSEPEWELACRTSEGWDYPYGREYDKGRCNTQSQTIQLAGGNPGCRGPSGAYDLSGNVYEWTSTDWSRKCYDKVVKGGNWNSGAENSKCRARFGQKVGEPSQAIGFRCCSAPQR